MNKLDAVERAAAAASGPRPYFLDNADCDRLLSMVLAMAGQLTTLHERLDTLTRVLEANDLLKPGVLEAFQPDASVQAERLAWDEAFVRRLLRVLSYEFEALKAGGSEASAPPE